MIYKKPAIIILLILSMCTCLTGCLRDEENEQDAAMWREQAEELAIRHIEEKYGFTPDVVESKSNRDASVVPVSNYVPQTIVTMSYMDQAFLVVADGDDETTDKVLDNYQAEEIRMAFQDYLNEYLQIPVYDVYLEAGRSVTIPGEEFDMQYNFFNEYYDGTNLEEILTKYSIKAYVKMVGNINLNELTTISRDSLVFHSKTELLMTSHESEEDADKCHLGTYFDDTVYSYALYITDAMDIRKGEISEYDFSVGQYEDIYYLCPGMDISEYTITKAEDSVDMSNWEHALYSYEKTGTNAYYISGTFTTKSPELYIYYPEELLPSKPDGVTGYRMGEAYLKTEYNKYRYDRHEGTSIDGYRVYNMSLKNKDDVSFRLLFETEL